MKGLACLLGLCVTLSGLTTTAARAVETYRCNDRGTTTYSQRPCDQTGQQVHIADDSRNASQIHSALERQQADQAYLRQQARKEASAAKAAKASPVKSSAEADTAPQPAEPSHPKHKHKHRHTDPRVFTAKVPYQAASKARL